MGRGLSRREFLKVTAAGTVLLATGLSAEACGDGAEPVRFFNAAQRDSLDAAARRILPIEGDAGVSDYIDALMSAFDSDPPGIFAGGPYSGRQPYGDANTDSRSRDVPPDSFKNFVPLSRVQELAWRARIYGTPIGIAAGAQPVTRPVKKGWRDLYQESLAALDAQSSARFRAIFVALPEADQDAVLAEADGEFVSTLTAHTLEAVYAVPEYGGNRERIGWRTARFDGDSQPLGYSIYNERTKTFGELSGKPLSTANPDEDYAGLDGAVLDFISGLATGLGGKRFS